jgi:hypothetical protein
MSAASRNAAGSRRNSRYSPLTLLGSFCGLPPLFLAISEAYLQKPDNQAQCCWLYRYCVCNNLSEDPCSCFSTLQGQLLPAFARSSLRTSFQRKPLEMGAYAVIDIACEHQGRVKWGKNQGRHGPLPLITESTDYWLDLTRSFLGRRISPTLNRRLLPSTRFCRCFGPVRDGLQSLYGRVARS